MRGGVMFVGLGATEARRTGRWGQTDMLRACDDRGPDPGRRAAAQARAPLAGVPLALNKEQNIVIDKPSQIRSQTHGHHSLRLENHMRFPTGTIGVTSTASNRLDVRRLTLAQTLSTGGACRQNEVPSQIDG